VTYTGVPDWQDATIPQGGSDILYSAALAAGTSQWTIVCSQTLGVYPYLFIGLSFATANTVEIVPASSFAIPGQQQWQYAAAGGPVYFIIPYGGPIGDIITVNIYTTAVAGGAGGVVDVIGLRALPDGLMWNGVSPCAKSFFQPWTPTNGSSTLIASPGSNQCLLIGSISVPLIVPQAATVSARLSATKSGNTNNLANCFATSSISVGNNVDYGNGILLDPGTGVTAVASATPTTAFSGGVFYDIVALY
jgi:hypothetical protein